jgi:hypothetical protein
MGTLTRLSRAVPAAVVALVLVGLVFLAGAPARSEPPVALTELGVDQVILKQGPRLRGTIFERANDGTLTIAVSRTWLQGTNPGYYETAAARERTARQAALGELHDRLVDWIGQRGDDRELSFFLGKQSERIDGLLKDEKDAGATDSGSSTFLLLTCPASEVGRIFVQPDARKQIALVAWRENLARVETRSIRSLGRELEKAGIDPSKEQVDLSDRLPVRKQSDAEWAARMAIVEYQYRKPLDFQGMGETLIRTGEGVKAPAAGELLAGVLKGQLGGQLTDLLEGPKGGTRGRDRDDGLQTGIQTAKREGVRGFRVTRVSTDIAARQATVETLFVARLPGERWETIWRYAESVDASRPDKERLKRIENDPQVASVLALIKATGLADGDLPIQSALQFGAATMQAQETADSKFLEFRDRYLQRLESPPLQFAETPARRTE